MWGHGLHLSGTGYGRVTGTCECGKEPVGSIIICGEFVDQLRTGYFLKMNLLHGVNK